MTDPVAPAKFAHPDDVVSRFEGTIAAEDLVTVPPGKVQDKIVDVEAQLIGLVASLDDPILPSDRRFRAAKALVAYKVAELMRNPDGAASVSSTMDGIGETRQLRGSTTSQAVWFSEQELDSVRLRKKRARFGTIPVGPGPWAGSARSCW